jgi:PAS domain S-box-containing protein
MADPAFTPDAALGLFLRTADLAFESIMVTEPTDDEGGSTVVYVNDAFTALTGYTAEEAVGATPGLMQGPDTDPDVLARLDAKMAAGEVFHGQTTNYRKDGTPFPIEWKVAPVTNDDGAVTHYVAVQREAPTG